MRVPQPGYRFFCVVLACLTVAVTALSVVQSRRLQAGLQVNEKLHDLNPLAISTDKLRDREFEFTVDSYGFKYRGKSGDYIDDYILMAGAWEKDILFFMEDYLRAVGGKDTAVLDIGANTGHHSLFLSTRVKEVHAIEPYPPILKRLHENVALNKFTNITVHEVGYGDREASLPFFPPSEGNHGNGSFRGNEAVEKTAGSLRIVAGDEHLKGLSLPPISLIKLDIEGFEEAALKGLRRTMDQQRPLMIVEVSTPRLTGTIGSFDQLKGLFPENYTFFILRESHRQRLNGEYRLDEFAPVAEQFFRTELIANFVAVPAEKVAKVPLRKTRD